MRKKKNNNLRIQKRSTGLVLHRTLSRTRAVPVSSVRQRLAHKLRTPYISISDIRKDNSLLLLGLEEQGEGVWRYTKKLRRLTSYHRTMGDKANKEESSTKFLSASNSENDGPAAKSGNTVGTRRGRSGNESCGDMPQEVKRKTRSSVRQVVPDVVTLSSDDEEESVVCSAPMQMMEQKFGQNELQEAATVEKSIVRRSSRSSIIKDIISPTESKPRYSRSHMQSNPQRNNKFSAGAVRTSSETPSVSRKQSGPAVHLDSDVLKKSSKIKLTHLAPHNKRSDSSLRAVNEKHQLKVPNETGMRNLRQRKIERHLEAVDESNGMKCVVPLFRRSSLKRVGDIATLSTPKKRVQFQTTNEVKEKNEKAPSITSSSNSAQQRRRVTAMKKEIEERKLRERNLVPKVKKNVGVRKGGKDNDKDFKVSNLGSSAVDIEVEMKPKVSRRRAKKLQMHWCEVCGIELHSLDIKLEHEFTHVEPRQLFVSLHKCHLNDMSVKLPIYVSREEVAAVPDPQVDTCSPIASDDDSHPLLPVENVINHDEYNAYDSLSSSEGEDKDGDHERPFTDESNLEHSKDEPGEVVSDDTASPLSSHKKSTPNKTHTLEGGSRERSKRKSQVKMRLWQGSPVTRSGRVVKVTQKSKDSLEQSSCVKALFPSEEKAEESACDTANVDGDTSFEDKCEPVDEYVEVVVMKGDLKDIVSSSTAALGAENLIVEEIADHKTSKIINEASVDENSSVTEISIKSNYDECGNIETEVPVTANGVASGDDVHESVKDLSNNENGESVETRILEGVSGGNKLIDEFVEKGNVTETEKNAVTDSNQNVTAVTESSVASEKQKCKKDDEATAEVLSDEVAEEKPAQENEKIMDEVRESQSPLIPGDAALKDDPYVPKTTGPAEEEKAQEASVLKVCGGGNASELISTNGVHLEMQEDSVDDNSKDIMLVDKSSGIPGAANLSENVQMQQSSEGEFASVAGDVDIHQFNVVNEGLEDISDDEWGDLSEEEMQETAPEVDGQLVDVEMDEVCPVNGISGGEMESEEDTDKDVGLAHRMSTEDPVSEEEMREIENDEDEMMTEERTEERGLATKGVKEMEVDMTEAVEDTRGIMGEKHDSIRDEQISEDLQGAFGEVDRVMEGKHQSVGEGLGQEGKEKDRVECRDKEEGKDEAVGEGLGQEGKEKDRVECREEEEEKHESVGEGLSQEGEEKDRVECRDKEEGKDESVGEGLGQEGEEKDRVECREEEEGKDESVGEGLGQEGGEKDRVECRDKEEGKDESVGEGLGQEGKEKDRVECRDKVEEKVHVQEEVGRDRISGHLCQKSGVRLNEAESGVVLEDKEHGSGKHCVQESGKSITSTSVLAECGIGVV